MRTLPKLKQAIFALWRADRSDREAPAMTTEQPRIARVDQAIAAQLSRSIAHNSRLMNRISLLQKAIENIAAAASNGRICEKGTAMYDRNTTLSNYCENVRRQDDALRSRQQDEAT
jgi:hypothetical protein